MQETIFYMGLQISKQFELEKEWLIIDNYYDSILQITKDYIVKGYDAMNKGLLDCINTYINENIDFIKSVLCSNNVSETKKWTDATEQYKDLLDLYKQYIDIFNNWQTTGNEDIDYANYELLVGIYHRLTDLLVCNNIIEKYGIKNYMVIESGEII